MTRIIIGENKMGRESHLVAYISTLFSKEIESLIELLKIPDIHYLSTTENTLGIEEVKNFTKSLIYKPFEEPYQVAIIDNADKLTTEAQNALLKALEEPPAQTIFILLAQREKNLLETILSRGEKHYAIETDAEEPDFAAINEFLEADFVKRMDIVEKLGADSDRDEISALLKTLLEYYKQDFEQKLKTGVKTDGREIQIIQGTREAIKSNASKKLALWNMVTQLGK